MKNLVKSILNNSGIDLVKYDRKKNDFNKTYNLLREYTMIPREAFIINLEIIEEFKNVNGDFVECGVWKGGMSAASALMMGKNRTVHLFDSFEGLPPAREIDGEAAIKYQQDTTSQNYLDNCATDESYAVSAMKIAGHKNYHIYKGWFQDTLENIKSDKIAILRIDGDWYDSVIVCLEKLYPLIVKGGVVIIDDYYIWDGCSKAIHDFLSANSLSSRIYQKNNRVAYLVK